MSRVDLELGRHLQRVTAPDELWSRIQAGLKTAPAPRWRLWAVCAATAAAIVGICYFSIGSDSSAYLSQAASRELGTSPEQLDFRSSDPAEIRAWVEAHAGLDIPLASAQSVSFVGVKLLQGSRFLVCVSYCIGDKKGKLFVARGGAGGPRHPSIRHTSYQGASIISWVAGGQSYAIATRKGSLDAACALCHMDRSVQAGLEGS
jgi:hypothetical protein